MAQLSSASWCDLKVIRLCGRLLQLVRRFLRDLAIRAQVSVENASDIGALEKGNEHFFRRGADDNAEDILPGEGVRLMLQAMSANGNDPPVLQ